MPRIVFRGFRDEQEESRYPFADNALLTSADGLDFGADTLLDAKLYPIGGGARLFLTAVSLQAGIATITVGNQTDQQLCSTSFNTVQPVDDVLQLTDAFGRPAGVLVSEAIRLSRFQTWGAGTHPFVNNQGEFAASVCVPTPEIELPRLFAGRRFFDLG